MRTLMYLFASLALVAVACNDNSGDENGLNSIEPVFSSEEISEAEESGEFTAELIDFFEKNPVSSFKFFDEPEWVGVCEVIFLTINSPEEFSAVVSSSVELPYIDFDNYTLVIGEYHITGGCYLKSQSVDIKHDVITFNLIFGDLGKGLTAMFEHNCWSLYPKLPQKPITYNVSRIKE